MLRPGIMPAGLPAGGTIGVVSPAGPCDPVALGRGVKYLEYNGFRVALAPHCSDRADYLAGSDSDRASDLVGFLTDSSIGAVICSRGGYGSGRLLPLLDWARLKSVTPKPFVGFSDIGAIQTALLTRLNWTSFSGPQVTLGLGGKGAERSKRHLIGMLTGDGRRLSWPSGEPLALTPVRGGKAEGVLMPICLSILNSLLGTPYLPNLDGAVLCLEDINEPPYRMDRMLWQLRESGIISDLAALVLGEFILDGERITERVISIARDLFRNAAFPIWAGLPYGHIDDRMTLPMGATVEVSSIGICNLVEGTA